MLNLPWELLDVLDELKDALERGEDGAKQCDKIFECPVSFSSLMDKYERL